MIERRISKSDTTASNPKKIWTVASVLLVLVLMTGIIVTNVFLSSSESFKSNIHICVTENSPLAAMDRTATATSADIFGNTTSSFEYDKTDISQNQNTWTNSAQVDIFKHSDSRVKSDGTGIANNVIAPGTSYDYTFSLQNSKKFIVKYTLNITGGNDSTYKIPIRLKILDSSGNSLVGADWISLSDFNNVSDIGTINPQSEKQYIIRWKWDFENGSDDYDTYLGDRAVNEEIPCHINISVISEYDSDSPNTDASNSSVSSTSSSITSSSDFITLVTTGDNRNVGIALLIFALCGVLAIILWKKRRV